MTWRGDRVVSEADLHAFLDDELPAWRAPLVAAYLRAHPREARRLAAYRADGEAIRRAFSEVGVPSQAWPRTPAHRPSAPERAWHKGWAVAAALLIGALGFAGGSLVARAPPISEHAEFIDEVASYHLVYERETTHLADVPDSERDELVGWLGERLGRKLAIPDLSAERLRFVGGRMLVANGRPVAQLLYARPGEPPVGICMTRTDEARRQLSVEAREGLRLASWNEGGYAYVVVGAMTADRIRRLAGRVSASFAEKPGGQYGNVSRPASCYPT